MVHHAIQPGFKDWTPYAVVLVELDEQRGRPTADEALRVIANLVTPDFRPEPEANVAIGKRVRAVFHDLERGFRPAPVHPHRRAAGRAESGASPARPGPGLVVQVFLTVDSEVWPATPAVFASPGAPLDLEPAISAYFEGHTRSGDYGVPFQLERLREHGLRATFFVEPLFSLLAGRPALARMVGLIQAAGQDVQVHAHTEWLSLVEEPGLPRTGHSLVRRYPRPSRPPSSAAPPASCARRARSRLRAFRAGSYGADLATLRALGACGIRMDSSLNVPYLGGACDIRTAEPALQPFDVGATLEVPITYFQDWPGHHRPLQLGACSSSEIEATLWGAARAGWRTAVLVFHSVELLRRVPDMALNRDHPAGAYRGPPLRAAMSASSRGIATFSRRRPSRTWRRRACAGRSRGRP